MILDISDMTRPRLVSELPFSPPFQSFIAVHTAQPLGRRLVVVNSEAIAENCDEPLGFAGLVDVEDETRPQLIRSYPCRRPRPARRSRTSACAADASARTTSISTSSRARCCATTTWCSSPISMPVCASTTSPTHGCRARAGYFLPPDPVERRGPQPGRLVPQSEDVVVDARGFIYVSDKNHGIYVLRTSLAG